MAYFERLDEGRFRATGEVSGAWRVEEQHIAPALGLLAHEVLRDHERRRDDRLLLSRVSYDLLGTVPVAEMEIDVQVVRPGRTIELVESRLTHGGRTIVRLRAWLLQPRDTDEISGSPFEPLPPPEELAVWDPTSVWPGGFIASVELRRDQVEPGRARFWVRPRTPLLDGEPVSALAAYVGVLDIANGMTVREDPRVVAFPNVDLTAHFFTEPRGEWVGFDTRVSFGPTGLGLTSSVVHDVHGPVGTLNQSLTVRPH
jgi:hypothetical protein